MYSFFSVYVNRILNFALMAFLITYKYWTSLLLFLNFTLFNNQLAIPYATRFRLASEEFQNSQEDINILVFLTRIHIIYITILA